MDEARARYREWRGKIPNLAAGKAWSIGEEEQDEGQVEKSVKAAMAGVEPNKRSRKASHGLGFFKEGLPEEKPKKRDARSKGPSRVPSKSKPSPITASTDLSQPNDGRSPFLSPQDEPTSPRKSRITYENGTSPISKTIQEESGEGYFDSSNSFSSLPNEEVISALPEEIRKHQNITPGADKGSSFSKSIPVMQTERSIADHQHEESDTVRKEGEDETGYDSSDLSPVKSAEDDDDSGEEQHTSLVSAVFIPHHTSHRASPEESDGEVHKSSDEDNEDLPAPRGTQEWLEEWKVPSKDVDKNYLSQEPKPLPLPSPNHVKTQSPLAEKDAYIPDTEPASVDHARLPKQEDHAHTDESDYSVADDNDITPTGSPKKPGIIPRSSVTRTTTEDKPKIQPLEAVELLPYRHQVGGHTIMWRFSKRAVCKKLNNAENKFYEKVEDSHPELLEFLPRYVRFSLSCPACFLHY